MFFTAYAFNQDIGGWEVGNVTDMSSMFENTSIRNAPAFNQDIGDWNVSKVTNMQYMFNNNGNNVAAFNQNIGDWDVSKVTDMIFMFSGVTLSIANYDALLAGWSKLELQSRVPFGAGNSQYCNQPARAVLRNPPNSWGISDGGPAMDMNCPLAFYVVIPDQFYALGQTVNVTLPEANGGTIPRSYALTGDNPGQAGFHHRHPHPRWYADHDSCRRHPDLHGHRQCRADAGHRRADLYRHDQ